MRASMTSVPRWSPQDFPVCFNMPGIDWILSIFYFENVRKIKKKFLTFCASSIFFRDEYKDDISCWLYMPSLEIGSDLKRLENIPTMININGRVDFLQFFIFVAPRENRSFLAWLRIDPQDLGSATSATPLALPEQFVVYGWITTTKLSKLSQTCHFMTIFTVNLVI